MRRLAAPALAVLALAGGTRADPGARPAAPHGVMVPGGFKSFAGKVVEKLDVAKYSYLRIATASGDVWAAVPRTDGRVGDEVRVADAYAMEGFESRELKRRFDVVWFGGLAGTEAEAAQLGAQHRDVARGPSGPQVKVKVKGVPRAPGAEGRTVGEVWAQREALRGKPVNVRGTVVRATAVMGKNFLHLRDGTGSATSGTDDVPVTTRDDVAVGDVVSARGTVAVDRDFGSGYTYRVLIEDAKVTR